jgi:hypothetical protein
MQHQEALAAKASERYLLSEMSEPERFEFEAHYFECAACAEDVCTGAALARGVKAVCAEDAALGRPTRVVRDVPGKRWFPWLSPVALWPAGAAAALACVAGYQGFVEIPSLRWAAAPRALSPVVLRAAARGAEQILEVGHDGVLPPLWLDVNSAPAGAPMVYEVIAPGGARRLGGPAETPPAGSPLIVLLPAAELREPGVWVFVLRTPQGVEISRHTFSLHFN